MNASTKSENRSACAWPLLAVAALFLGGCAGAPRWGAWSTRPSSAEIARALEASPYENYNYPSQPDPALLGRPAEPGSGRAAAAKLSAPRRPPQVEVTMDPKTPEPETDEEESAP